MKAEAERWLEEFVSSLGAVFPDALREAVRAERDSHLKQAGEAGDCPHAWRPETSCGAARALGWILDIPLNPAPDAPERKREGHGR